ncbi:MAG TPA: PilN domain-containing protein [Dissulfurispiraceae bacterium]|nr:PilN domain-containing protein [Dissulfurispiraceae bacterium]
MIKINLLEKTKEQKTQKTATPKFLVTLGLVTGGVLALAVAAVFGMSWHVSSLKDQSEANKKQIAQLKQKITEVQRYEKINKEVEQRVNLVDGLRKNQAAPVRLLDEVSSILTSAEGVWLTTLSYKADSVSAEGFSFTNENLVSFVDGLKRSPKISDVYLEESSRATQDKMPVYKFKLRCNFRI